MATMWMQIDTDEYAERGDAYIKERVEQYSDKDGELECYRAAAAEAWEREGEIEIDPNACVSVSDDDGAYVQAWVWVSDKQAGVNREEEN